MRLSFSPTITPFPTYLTPSIPFRRRKSSSDSNSTTQSPTNSPPNRTAQTYLTGHTSALRCSRCLSDLAPADKIISKGFTGRHGRAYLVAPPSSLDTPSSSTATSRYSHLPDLPNTYTHKPVARNLVTGVHTVCDISCTQCGSMLGWKYVAAEEELQRYKVGKFILETLKVCRTDCWEGEENADATVAASLVDRGARDDEIQFDSQDEDECEDLFMGVWKPEVAAKRRKAKSFARRNN